MQQFEGIEAGRQAMRAAAAATTTNASLSVNHWSAMQLSCSVLWFLIDSCVEIREQEDEEVKLTVAHGGCKQQQCNESRLFSIFSASQSVNFLFFQPLVIRRTNTESEQLQGDR